MEFVCHTDWDQLPPAADRLFERGESVSLFLSRRWFETLAAHALEDDQALLLACVVQGDSVLAILPLRVQPDGNWHALSNYYTSLYTPLISDANQQAIVECLAAGLGRQAFRSLRLEPVAADDATCGKLQQALASHGLKSHRVPRLVNWSHPVRGQSYAQYLAERPSSLRNTLARKRRRMDREPDCEIRLYTHFELDQALTDYQTVHRASWKAGERFTGFLPALVHAMAESGGLRFALLYIGGQPVAGQIWFVVHGKASIFRLAYDEAWQRYSPGSVLTAFLMEHVIDHDKVESIDFLTGNEAYKQDWMSERRVRWGWVCVKGHRTGSRMTRLRRLLDGLGR